MLFKRASSLVKLHSLPWSADWKWSGEATEFPFTMTAVLSKVMIRQSQSWVAVFACCSSERSPGQARITFMSILWISYRDLLYIHIDLTCKLSDPSHSRTLEIFIVSASFLIYISRPPCRQSWPMRRMCWQVKSKSWCVMSPRWVMRVRLGGLYAFSLGFGMQLNYQDS